MTDFLKTPLLFLVFNRPDITIRTFDAIRKAAPKKLYIACDGPRASHADDCDRVVAVRNIVSKVDWNCQVKTLYSEKNMGCKIGGSSAFDWFFENEEEGILLEDDCLPDPSFFTFCEELLEKYRYDEKIMTISGNNFQPRQPPSQSSYYFSRYFHLWGWAGWRRSWAYFDVKMSAWPEVKREKLLESGLSRKEYQFWAKRFDEVFHNRIDTFDYQLLFAFWMQNGLNILPSINLVSNIGFGDDATHTKKVIQSHIVPARKMTFPLQHPPCILRDDKKDQWTFAHHHQVSLWQLIKFRWDALTDCFLPKPKIENL